MVTDFRINGGRKAQAPRRVLAMLPMKKVETGMDSRLLCVFVASVLYDYMQVSL